VSPTELWPPLELVEATLEGAPTLAMDEADSRAPKSQKDPASSSCLSSEKAAEAAYLLLPLTELASRRAAVAARAFSIEWASGRLVQMTVNGVLLDRVIRGKQWTGWIAANESNWASAFDVLLEPCDDPFEPMFGVIQAWNPVTLYWSEDLQARIVCEVSAMRLAAIRAVSLECAAGLMIPTPSEPGRIALRTAGGTFSVLTGTPLGMQDLRHDYQNAYRTVAARLMAQQLTRRVSKVENQVTVSVSSVPRAKPWFAGGWYVWPTFILVTLIVLAQNAEGLAKVAKAAVGAISTAGSVPGTTLGAPEASTLRVQWRSGASMDEVQQLLRATSASVVDGPDVQGFYRLKSNNVSATRNALTQSGLVRQLLTP
jgi:hypothetical protein